jgi:hypothetical protein
MKKIKAQEHKSANFLLSNPNLIPKFKAIYATFLLFKTSLKASKKLFKLNTICRFLSIENPYLHI